MSFGLVWRYVTVQYARPLIGNQASLQDLEGLKTASFGPVSITTF